MNNDLAFQNSDLDYLEISKNSGRAISFSAAKNHIFCPALQSAKLLRNEFLDLVPAYSGKGEPLRNRDRRDKPRSSSFRSKNFGAFGMCSPCSAIAWTSSQPKKPILFDQKTILPVKHVV